MKYSQLQTRHQIAAMTAFVVIMAAIGWLAHKAAFDWLPQSLVNYLAVALIAFAAGLVIGEKSTMRELGHHRHENRTAADFE